jgi:hypothetical protein
MPRNPERCDVALDQRDEVGDQRIAARRRQQNLGERCHNSR